MFSPLTPLVATLIDRFVRASVKSTSSNEKSWAASLSECSDEITHRESFNSLANVILLKQIIPAMN